jgi:hypothetical protein
MGVMRIPRQSASLNIVLDQKQLQNMDYLNCLRSLITNVARCARVIKSRIAMAKAAFKKKKKNLFTRNFNLIVRQELVNYVDNFEIWY